MVRTTVRARRVLSLCATAALVLSACGGTTPTTAPGTQVPTGTGAAPSPTSAAPTAGGTIFLLNNATGWDQVDPQRVYTGEDLAFFAGTIYRSLESYIYSADPTQGTTVTPDMATDTGTATNGGKTWTFTLRDGVTWQDGSAVKCEDIAYGVSRTFAADVINQGPTYASQYLAIPVDAKGNSQYPGPYKATKAQQALFDSAVTCSADHKTITFNLSSAHADFAYTTTLGFSPVPNPTDHPKVDSGESYGQTGHLAWSTGPYMVQSYTTGPGGKMILVRNPNWSKASDPIRGAYPDTWEVDFGLDTKIIDQRLIATSGPDETAIDYGGLSPENQPTVFQDANTPNPDYATRAVGGFDPYTRYLWINVNKVKDVNVRLAMAAALDRDAMRTNLGGDFYGDFADGAVKPNIGPDYAATGFWTAAGPFGADVPNTGDATLAKTFLAKSGGAAPTLNYNFSDTPTRNKEAAIIIAALGKAGITVTPKPIDPAHYYSTVFDPAKAGDFGYGGWGADWPNASTVVPDLFTQKGGWDLSQVDDAAFNTAVDAALAELDRTKQEADWQALNKQATNNVWIIPTFFGLSYNIAGDKIGGVYRWPAYGSWPYGVMYVKQ